MRLENVSAGSIALLWATLVVLCGCLCQTCLPNKCDSECERVGNCAVSYKASGEALTRCYAASEEDCRQSRACAEHGWCFLTEQGGCVTEDRVEEKRCAISARCTNFGGCSPMDEGYCAPSSDAHCTESRDCADRGHCTYTEGEWGQPHCMVATDEECARSTECRTEGKCTKQGRMCRPSEVAHCTESTRCATHQECTFVPPKMLHEGTCIHLPENDADCTQSTSCRTEGKCSYVELDTLYRAIRCEPTTSAHCSESTECAERGICALEPGKVKDGKRHHANRCTTPPKTYDRR